MRAEHLRVTKKSTPFQREKDFYEHFGSLPTKIVLDNVLCESKEDSKYEKAPWLMAFGFGLLHGLGFANVLTGIGIANDQLVMSLLFFNIGIEAGQLLLIPVFSLLIWATLKTKQNFPSS